MESATKVGRTYGAYGTDSLPELEKHLKDVPKYGDILASTGTPTILLSGYLTPKKFYQVNSQYMPLSSHMKMETTFTWQ
jgi:hypothetical protein